ncbi:MAG: response regulator [Planctomycetota bacterium]
MQDGKHVILCLDDDPDICKFLKTVLENGGYIASTAVTAEEGLEAYKEINPDLVIVDLMMEEIDAGATFVKELRLLGNAAPIYMLSSVGDDFNLATDSAALGLAGVFQKPVSPDRLLSVLKVALRETGP